MPRPISIAEIIDRSPVSAIQKRTIILCVVLAVLDGFDALLLGYAVPAIAKDWEMSPAEFGVVMSVSAAAMVLGSILFGSISDRLGRRRLVLVGTVMFSILTLLTAFASSMPVLIGLRVLAGLALGGVTPNLLALSSEVSPRRIRGTVVTVLTSSMAMGAFLGGIVAASLVPTFGWRVLFVVGGVVPLLAAVAAYRWLPESIAFLATHGESRKVADYVRSIDGASTSFGPDTEFVYNTSEVPEKASMSRLFSGGRAVTTAALWGAYFLTLLVLYFLMGWMPTLFEDAGMSAATASTATALFSLGGVVGGIVFGRIGDRIGSPSWVGVGSFTFAAAFILLTAGLMGTSQALTLSVVFITGFGVLGSAAIMNVIAAASYPTAIRGAGIGWALGVGRIGSITGPAVGAIALALSLGAATIFSSMAVPALAAAILLAVIARRSSSAAEDSVPSVVASAASPTLKG
ncbi:MFS transporter [Rhodococcus sp. 14C212]|uniref:MFS transporter n=1 Tax=Rhodococcus sp. 14C212 TaxID=2711209 RepID=UPI0013EC5C21|nr:MFS transporter [Rhodococcus sp. 14C212]NGP05112.1 MFS transporter [Rhodococcus sp. 14C212]